MHLKMFIATLIPITKQMKTILLWNNKLKVLLTPEHPTHKHVYM